ncbi:MAG: dUTP diphosphatase [Parachlamydiales bacterium]|nr:dUTP diphosphatase [Parachlamydiales bacterium]
MSYEEVMVELLAEDEVSAPHYGSEGASGADVRAHILEDIIIAAGESALIPTGIHLAIPQGYEIQVRPRSGLALKNQITVLNTPGTIDSDYRGEIKVILINHGKVSFTVHPGMRIAQFVLAAYAKAQYVRKGDLASTLRGSGGFGHTGLN